MSSEALEIKNEDIPKSLAHAHNPKLLPTSSDFPQVMQL